MTGFCKFVTSFNEFRCVLRGVLKEKKEEETPPKRSQKITSNQKQKDKSFFKHKLVQSSSKLNSSSEDKNLPFSVPV